MIYQEGMRFGRLSLISKTDQRVGGSVVWKCRCDCGKIVEVSSRDLGRGAVKSCGCLKKERLNLIGKKFGSLTVISRITSGSHALWECKCDCGHFVTVRGDSLTRGKTISCGCSKSGPQKAKQMFDGRKIVDHTSEVFFNGTVSKNSRTRINGVTVVNGKYRAYIGYKNKLYYLISTSDISLAKMVRAEADEAVKNGTFEQWISSFCKKGGRDGK